MSLKENEVAAFIEKGYHIVRNAFSPGFIQHWWHCRERFLIDYLSLNPSCKDQSHLYLPVMRRFDLYRISPTVDGIINQLMGGEDRIRSAKEWGDGFTVALPHQDPFQSSAIKQEHEWHKDGLHRSYLDSPEVGLVAIVLWTESTISNGATCIAEGSIKPVSEMLLDQPSGCHPDDFSSNQIDRFGNDHSFFEGEAGDVLLMHPFLVHARRPNQTHQIRAITNPSLALKKSLNFKRKDSNYSPVELAVLHALGVSELNFSMIGKRGMTKSSVGQQLKNTRTRLKEEIDSWNRMH